MWLVGAAWGIPALAHGPAPSVLEVLSWEAGSCTELAPTIVRSNIGLLTRQPDGSYAFGCPSRWGAAEQALAATDGSRVLLAGSGGVFVSDDGGCTTRRLVIDEAETPVVARGGAELWLVTRNFDVGDASLWRVGVDLERVDRSSDRIADGLVLDADGGWLAGAVPQPSLARLVGEVVTPLAPPWPSTEQRLDRLTPRAVDGGGVWLLAGSGAARTLWWTDGAEVVVGPGPAESLHGPARLGDRWLAVLDGALWAAEAGVWAPTGFGVTWTCLQDTQHGPLACGLDEASLVIGLDAAGPMTERVVSLDQLGPPAEACPDPDGACALDWLHFGGESGYDVSAPATCPGEPRGPLPVDEGPPAGEDPRCGCRHGGAAWPLAALLLRRRRLRAAPPTPEGLA